MDALSVVNWPAVFDNAKRLECGELAPAFPMALTTLVCHLLARNACLWATLGLLATAAFGPSPAQAAVTEAWVQRYNNVSSNSADRAFKVVRDAADDIIVTGTTEGDMLIIKYSGTDGTVHWQKRYNDSGPNSDHGVLAVDGSGNVVVRGDSATVKFAAADGALLWEQRYSGPWNTINTQTASASGLIQCDDAPVPPGQAFYRTVQP